MSAASGSKSRSYRSDPGRWLMAILVFEGFCMLADRFPLLPKGWLVLIAVTAVILLFLLLVFSLLVSWIFNRRFQFSVRFLLALVIVAAVPFSWLAVGMCRAKSQARMVIEMERLGGTISDDLVFYSATRVYHNEPREPEWIRRLMGDHFFKEVQTVDFAGAMLNDSQLAEASQVVGIESVPYLGLKGTTITDSGLVCLRRWAALQILELQNTATTDAGLANLRGLSDLEYLDLSNTNVTGTGLDYLKGLTKLKSLYLENAPVTDLGLQWVGRLTQLRSLCLGGQRVTDLGLQHLDGMTQLHTLRLTGPQVTDTWLEHIKGLDRIEYLSLDGSRVTDTGLLNLKGLKSLKYLNLRGTKLTHLGDESLQKAIPSLQQIDR